MRDNVGGLTVLLVVCAHSLSAEANPITEAEKRYCADAYHRYCGEYGLESNALRNCMNRNGRSLPHACMHRRVDRCWRGLTKRSRAS
jgi:hypothetical protein